MPETLFIGIDGGGTSCRARIVDARGRRIGQGVGGPANVATDPALTMSSILEACDVAAKRSGIDEADLRQAHAGFGLAGGAVTTRCNEFRQLLQQEGFFASAAIATDAYATWLGAFRGEPGAILILGTGSCGLAVVDGVEKFVSGYGPIVGDEASSNWIGRQAIRRALWAYDGRIPPTRLAKNILRHFDKSPEKIVSFASSASAEDFGRFSPPVFSHAAKGDALAMEIITEAAGDAARMIEWLVAAGAPLVYLHGGLAKPLLAWLPKRARKRTLKSVNDIWIPVEGAILMARQNAAAVAA
jgi:glucosamine kinase